MSNPAVTKNVAPNLYFLSNGPATVAWDLLASSKVSTTSLSGIGSTASTTQETSVQTTSDVATRFSENNVTFFSNHAGGCQASTYVTAACITTRWFLSS